MCQVKYLILLKKMKLKIILVFNDGSPSVRYAHATRMCQCLVVRFSLSMLTQGPEDGTSSATGVASEKRAAAPSVRNRE